jgi:uncharacterized protein YjbI with pentapeptide repeats
MIGRQLLGPEPRTAHVKWVERGRTGDGRLALVDVSLDEQQLSGGRLIAARFERCSFDAAVIEMTDFDEVEMRDCRGAKTSLSRDRMYDSVWAGCTFSESRFWRARFVRARIEKSSFVGSMFEDAAFPDARISDTSFAGANLSFVTFDRAHLINCDLRGANLTSATLVKTRFDNCDLRGAVLPDLSSAILENCQRD